MKSSIRLNLKDASHKGIHYTGSKGSRQLGRPAISPHQTQLDFFIIPPPIADSADALKTHDLSCAIILSTF